MKDEEDKTGPVGDDSILVTAVIGGQRIAEGVAVATGGLAVGTALAGSGIPVAATFGAGVAAGSSAALGVASSAATAVGATTLSSAIGGAAATGAAVGAALAPVVLPLALIAAPFMLHGWRMIECDHASQRTGSV
jgi:hypothetical protein